MLGKREEKILAQLAKKKWLMDGDKNSKFFHVMVNQHRNASLIQSMQLENGSLMASPKETHEGAVDYFESFLSEQQAMTSLDLGNFISKVISMEDNESSICDSTEKELKVVLLAILKDNSPGSNRFSSDFFISCWEFVKDG